MTTSHPNSSLFFFYSDDKRQDTITRGEKGVECKHSEKGQIEMAQTTMQQVVLQG
jgi:hypothetical protein